ncbi:MAG: hypothetical protein AAF620_06785 [Bacteroidota bacterium]
MQPTEEQIKEIAEILECGELCFFHKITGMIEHHPDPNDVYFDLEPWQETMDKIDEDWGNYQKFVKMDSNQAFQVMESFANTLMDENFKNRLFKQLSQRKPFSKFKWTIDNSEYRQNWFDFKKQSYINWVREQLDN